MSFIRIIVQFIQTKNQQVIHASKPQQNINQLIIVRINTWNFFTPAINIFKLNSFKINQLYLKLTN